MVKKEGNWIGIIIGVIIFLIFVFLHTFFHFINYGTGIRGFYEVGFESYTLGNFELGRSFDQEYPQVFIVSQIVMLIEWLFVFFIMMAALTHLMRRYRGKITMEKKKGFIEKKNVKFGNKTDLDLLYDLVKEKGRISLPEISAGFRVSPEVARTWMDILENGKLASINYPKFGEAELVIMKKEESKKLNEKEKEKSKAEGNDSQESKERESIKAEDEQEEKKS